MIRKSLNYKDINFLEGVYEKNVINIYIINPNALSMCLFPCRKYWQ